MSQSRARLRALVAVPVIAVMFVAGGFDPAEAGRQSTRDQSRDVRQVALATNAERRVRTDKARDLLAATARFRDGKVVVSVDFRNLLAAGYTLFVDLKTPVGRYRATFDKTGRRPFMYLSTVSGQGAPCHIVRGGARRTADRVTVVVPRRCIGAREARWVRFGAMAWHEVDSGIYRIDDVRRDNAFDVSNDGVRIGPRLRYS